jgi:hypothetical protein
MITYAPNAQAATTVAIAMPFAKASMPGCVTRYTTTHNPMASAMIPKKVKGKRTAKNASRDNVPRFKIELSGLPIINQL